MDRMKKERFDRIVIPENLSQRVRKGIREGEKIYMRNKRKKMVARAAAAAAILLVCVGIFASSPALASKIPVIRNIFKFLQGDYSWQGDLDSVAQKFEPTEGIKTQGEGDENEGQEGAGVPQADHSDFSQTVNGVTVTVSEAYCSVEAVYLSLTITSEEAFEDTMTNMEEKPIIYLKGTADYSFDPLRGDEAQGYANGGTGPIEGKFINSHTYAGIYRMDILDIVSNNAEMKEKYRALEEFDLDFTINQIIGDRAEPEPLDMQGKTEEDLKAMTDEEWHAFMSQITPADRNQFPNRYENWWIDGPFVFSLPIKMDKDAAQVVTVDEMNDTGAGLYEVAKTKFEITVQEKCSEERAKKGVFLIVLDADGRFLPSGSSGYASTYAVGDRDVSKICVYVCDYTEYMNELKGFSGNADFRQILEERALYRKEIVF